MAPGIFALIVSFTSWAVVHSLLANLRVKTWARRTFGERVNRWYRLGFVVLAVVTLAPILLLFALLPDRTLYVVPVPWRWVMIAGQTVGVAGAAAAVLQTGAFRFVGLAQVFEPLPVEGDGVPLQVRGLYCHVRHPIYFFSLLLMWLTPMMTTNLLTLYMLMTVYFYVGSVHEESRLLAEFGEAYRGYQRRVPRLIPRLRRCYPSSRGDERAFGGG